MKKDTIEKEIKPAGRHAAKASAEYQERNILSVNCIMLAEEVVIIKGIAILSSKPTEPGLSLFKILNTLDIFSHPRQTQKKPQQLKAAEVSVKKVFYFFETFTALGPFSDSTTSKVTS